MLGVDAAVPGVKPVSLFACLLAACALCFGPVTDPEDAALRRSFDAVAGQYVKDFADELAGKPLDRKLLTLFASRAGVGRVLDIGCGPGQVGDFVAALGPTVIGVDFSAESLAQGVAHFPRLRFACADFRALPFADESLDGIDAFYCLIYLSEGELSPALAEWRRVLHPGAPLLIAVHGGRGEDHFDDYRGIPIDITLRWRNPERFAAVVASSGFSVDALTVREPYAEEHPSPRVYVEATAT
jgi:SAM-dependent methyltransferase